MIRRRFEEYAAQSRASTITCKSSWMACPNVYCIVKNITVDLTASCCNCTGNVECLCNIRWWRLRRTPRPSPGLRLPQHLTPRLCSAFSIFAPHKYLHSDGIDGQHRRKFFIILFLSSVRHWSTNRPRTTTYRLGWTVLSAAHSLSWRIQQSHSRPD